MVSVAGGAQLSRLFGGLDAGSYTAFIYDQVAAGCDASVDVALEIPVAVGGSNNR
jgi:hypothetical protein